MQFEDVPRLTQDPDYLVAKLTLISSMTVLGISYGVVVILATLLVADTVTGVIKAVALRGWDSVSAGRFWEGVLTKLGIVIVPFLLALISVVVKTLTESDASYNFDPLILLVLWTLIANDLISFLTNLLSIRTKKDYKNKDLVAVMINTLRQLIFKLSQMALERMSNWGAGNEENENDNAEKDSEKDSE